MALRTAARHLDAAADVMSAILGSHLGGLRFGAAGAGRAHGVSGAGVRAAVDGLIADAGRWAQDARDLAAALDTCAERHDCAEAHAAAALR